MTIELSRRTVVKALGIGAASAQVILRSGIVFAADQDLVTIGWPNDVPSWDPEQRTVPDAQPIYKMVFDQPLDQAPDLKLIPKLVKAWNQAPDALSLTLDFRDDVTFHDGSKMTADDFRYSFFDRVKAGHKIDVANIWGTVTDIEVTSPTHAIMHFKSPNPTASVWLAFLCSFVVPKAYMEKVGVDEFVKKPIGTGPYKLADYELNSRIVLERNDSYWGPKPTIKRVTFQIIKDPSARVAAIQSGQVDLTLNVPVREAERFAKEPGFKGELVPITRVIILQPRGDLGFADKNVRLAAHHAIDKKALSKSFYGGAAVPLSVAATPGSPGYVEDYTFPYDVELAKKLLADSGFSTAKPAKIKMATTNGQFPSDYDIARAIVQMWKKVGIDAEIDVIEYDKYFELNRGNKLPEVTLYSWDNATGDPEIYIGYLLNPHLPFSAWKEKEIGDEIAALFSVADYDKRIAAYKEINKKAVEFGAMIPLLQSVLTVARKSNVDYTHYENGWILADTIKKT
jgi:peptide/nickel transport system substrate-binding protein